MMSISIISSYTFSLFSFSTLSSKKECLCLDGFQLRELNQTLPHGTVAVGDWATAATVEWRWRSGWWKRQPSGDRRDRFGGGQPNGGFFGIKGSFGTPCKKWKWFDLFRKIITTFDLTHQPLTLDPYSISWYRIFWSMGWGVIIFLLTKHMHIPWKESKYSMYNT